MVKNIFTLVAITLLLASCSSLKPLNFTSNKQVMSSPAAAEPSSKSIAKNAGPKFIDDISVTPAAAAVEVNEQSKKQTKTSARPEETVKTRGFSIEETTPAPAPSIFGDRSSAIEKASTVQLKYAVLLNTEVEQLSNTTFYEKVDEWYGTRYRMGGTTKSGVDCSAFVQAVFAAAFGVAIPRTAREQHRVARQISRTELKEGDLVFFNTRGGVSHVGIYLQNNKFVHSSTSRGVTVSDLFEPYYVKRFIAAGRIENANTTNPEEAPLSASSH
jgi:cell wall-associated NlpC family hydrolase